MKNIIAAFQQNNYNHNNIENGTELASFLSDDYKTEAIGYERPYFNAPTANGPNGNVFQIIALAQSCLKQNNYHYEANELNLLTKSNKFSEIIDKLALFLNFETCKKTVTMDGEHFYNIKQTPESVKNNLHNFELNNNTFDILTENTFGRNIFYYVDSLDMLQQLWNQNEILNNNNKSHFDLLQLDNFNSTVLHTSKNLDIFNFYLNQLQNKYPHIVNTFFMGKNNYNYSACSHFTQLFTENLQLSNDIFETQTKLDDYMKPFWESLLLIKTFNPEYSNQFKDILIKDFFQTKFKLNDLKKCTDMLDKSWFKYSLDEHLVKKEPKAKVKI